MKKISILHCLHWSQGGIVKFIELLLSNTTSTQFEHHVIILNSDTGSNHQLRSLCKTYSALGYDNEKLGAIRNLKRLINDIRPDIFHSHSFLPGVIGRAISSNRTIQIATVHNEYPHYITKTIRNLIKLNIEYLSLKSQCNSVVCVSESVMLGVAKAMPGLPLEMIQNGVPIGAMRNPINRNHTDSLTILSLGRLDAQKGYDKLIEAYAILHEQGVNARLRIVGEGGLRMSLEALINKLGIKDFVSMPGFSNNPNSELQNADIYVCSSSYEGLSIATAEALSMGVPLVTTRVGVASMMCNNHEAIIVSCNTPVSLANALNVMINNLELRYRIGEGGRDFALKNLDIRNTVSRYEALYGKLIHG